MLKFKAYQRAFKVDLISCFISLILLTIVIVMYSYHVNANNTLQLSKKLVNTAINHAVSNTNYYLKSAEDTPLLSSILLSNQLNIVEDKFLENHVINILQHKPFLFMYYIADEQGNLILGYRNKFGTISTKFINQQQQPPYSLWKYRNQDGGVYEQKNELNPEYDPRQRPWYIGAKKTGEIYWTGIYNFYNKESDHIHNKGVKTEDLYGLSISSPIINKDNQFIGVAGVDISLNSLSDFLALLKIGKHGKVLVVNNARELILFPDVESNRLVNHQQKSMRVREIESDWVKEGTQMFFKKYQSEFFYHFKGQDYFVKSHDFSKATGKDWFLIIIVPVDDFLGSIKQARLMSLFVVGGMLLVSILFSLWLSRTLSRPIENMTENMNKINALNFTQIEQLSSPIKEFQQMSMAMNSMTHILKAFLKYVPPSLVHKMMQDKKDIELGGDELNMTLFFSDIEGFTEIAEDMGAEELMQDLSAYFDQMVNVIVLENQGTIDKYIGDSVMAFWGAPNYTSDHAKLACYSALGCQKVIAKINLTRKAEDKAPFNTRIGINSGLSIVGNIGSSDRFNYTVVGDNVNLASRIEGLNKIYHTQIIVSQMTQKQVRQYFVFRALDSVIVKGKNEGIKIYQLVAEVGDCDEKVLQVVALANKAFKQYLNRDFMAALKLYQQILKDNSQDQPALIMSIKCQRCIDVAPDQNWTGATRLFNK